MLNLESNLAEIPTIGPRFVQRFAQMGIHTVKDLLYHFPTRYEDFSQIYPINDLEPGQQATIQGTVEDVNVRRTWKRHLTIVEAKITDESGTLRAVWFNQPYIKNVLRPGRLANFSGKVALSDDELYLSHPTYELVDSSDAETRHTARLVPIYPETRGLTSKGIRFVIQPLLNNLRPVAEWLPAEVRRAHGLLEINAALRAVHFPEHIEDSALAKKRFAFEDLFLLHLLNIRQKLKLAREKAPPLTTDIERLKKVLASLPFELTQSQKRSLWEIVQDLARNRPMNRLLQGDVGSGKTVIAALAALVASWNGYQTALMAPTEVLARQHFATLKQLFLRLAPSDQAPLAILTAAGAKALYGDDLETEIKKPKLAAGLRTGDFKIVIGTHALIQKGVDFERLGLVVIDEQHRFGVNQRQALTRGSARIEKPGLPHFLSMSATPIPRTLMLTVFGDLDISTIDELPAGRKKIVTKIVDPQNRLKAYGFIRAHIQKGRQTFVICPRIESADASASDSRQAKLWEVKSVKEEYEKLSRKIFPELRVAMLHGQLKAKEKEAIMKKFRGGETDILVSTSVVEVGVDVPNATIMMIEGAERFGLAQLYQFRGRVGRGEHQSYCFLFTDSAAKQTAERLTAIVTAKNGFELAEMDLELRGPGEFIGDKQTGLPDIAMRGLQNAELIRDSRQAAVEVIQADPNLKNNPALAAKLKSFAAAIHLE